MRVQLWKQLFRVSHSSQGSWFPLQRFNISLVVFSQFVCVSMPNIQYAACTYLNKLNSFVALRVFLLCTRADFILCQLFSIVFTVDHWQPDLNMKPDMSLCYLTLTFKMFALCLEKFQDVQLPIFCVINSAGNKCQLFVWNPDHILVASHSQQLLCFECLYSLWHWLLIKAKLKQNIKQIQSC